MRAGTLPLRGRHIQIRAAPYAQDLRVSLRCDVRSESSGGGRRAGNARRVRAQPPRDRRAARRHHRLHPELRGQRCTHDALSRRRDVRRRDALRPSCRLGRGASRAAAHEPRLAR